METAFGHQLNRSTNIFILKWSLGINSLRFFKFKTNLLFLGTKKKYMTIDLHMNDKHKQLLDEPDWL